MKRVILAFSILVLTGASVQGAAPTSINFQGLLTDTAGTPLANGNYNVLFLIYDVATSGVPLWTEIQSVGLKDGLFTVNLGSINSLNETIFASSPRYLAVQVGANPELSPRSLLVSVPWSMQSTKAESAVSAEHATTSDTADFAFVTPGTGGSIFTRWGNNTAPVGSSLIYSGYVYGGHYTMSAPIDLVIVQGGDPGDSVNTLSGLLYPAETETSGSPLAAYIPQDSKVKGAVCFCDSPTLTIWGTHTPPAGWSVLYTGFTMGNHYTHSGSGGPVCMDHLNFQAESLGSSNGTLLYPVSTATQGFGVNAELGQKLVKCVVCKKD